MYAKVNTDLLPFKSTG